MEQSPIFFLSLVVLLICIEILVLRSKINKIENLPSNKDFLKQLKNKKGKK